MDMGPIKQEAVSSLRKEIEEARERDGLGRKARCLWLSDKIESGENVWLDRVLYDDEVAWNAVVEGFGMWATLHWGKAFPTKYGVSKLSSWADLSKWAEEDVVRARDLLPGETLDEPIICPYGLVYLGCHHGDDEVHAAAWLDPFNNLDSPVFYHPVDPDAALVAAIRHRES